MRIATVLFIAIVLLTTLAPIPAHAQGNIDHCAAGSGGSQAHTTLQDGTFVFVQLLDSAQCGKVVQFATSSPDKHYSVIYISVPEWLVQFIEGNLGLYFSYEHGG